eukprot:m.112623 g.112623  ORF g.112623 m.112623 type:complete len:58 (-) comp17032_c1_seq33:1082-1255(-)
MISSVTMAQMTQHEQVFVTHLAFVFNFSDSPWDTDKATLMPMQTVTLQRMVYTIALL